MRLIIFCVVACVLISCDKKDWEIVSQTKTSTPVVVSDLYGTFNGVPTVQTSLSGGGAIKITLSIPPESGRTIKEITRVALGTVPNNYKVVQATSGLYNTAQIAGSGTSVTFNTTVAEYSSKSGQAVTAAGTATSFLSRYFYFLVTLDNGEQIMPVPVRVYVNS